MTCVYCGGFSVRENLRGGVECSGCGSPQNSPRRDRDEDSSRQRALYDYSARVNPWPAACDAYVARNHINNVLAEYGHRAALETAEAYRRWGTVVIDGDPFPVR